MSFLSRFVLHPASESPSPGPQAAAASTNPESSQNEPPRTEPDGEDFSNRRASSKSPSPPSTPTSRRVRSESLDAELARREVEVKRRKDYAVILCEEHGLAEGSLDDFVELDEVRMLMSIHASLLAGNKVERKSAAIAFIKSEEFKEILKDRLRGCLLSPNLTAYVLELANKVFSYAKKNLEMFKIPVEAVEDPEMSDSISTLMKEILTSQRSNMKQKIAAGIRNTVHISVLSRSLAPGGSYEVTMAHWSRFAFLRAGMVIFDTVVEECKEAQTARKKAGSDSRQQPTPEAGEVEVETEAAAGESPQNPERVWVSSEYWEFLDLLLCDIRKAARKAEATPHGREKHVQAFFTDCLQKDLRKFPAKAAQVNNPPYEKVSVQWQKAIHTELIW